MSKGGAAIVSLSDASSVDGEGKHTFAVRYQRVMGEDKIVPGLIKSTVDYTLIYQ